MKKYLPLISLLASSFIMIYALYLFIYNFIQYERKIYYENAFNQLKKGFKEILEIDPTKETEKEETKINNINNAKV